jgi:hypothetical protein
MEFTILEKLESLTHGLLYISESEHPFDILMWNDVKTPEEFVSKIALSHGVLSVEPVDVEQFFFNLTDQQDRQDGFMPEQAFRYRTLHTFLQEHLSQLLVIKSGKGQKDVFIAGFTPVQNCIALHTVSIET